MGCSSSLLWLLLVLGASWGMDHGETETVLGTLGKATILRIPARLQNLNVSFREVFWKRGGPHKKQVLVKYSGGEPINHFQGRIRFHSSDFSLEILNTSRQDGQLYEYGVSTGLEEEVQQIQLKVYEPVSHPSIQILRRELSNGSCSVALNCTVERGDDVSYSWASQDSGTWGSCSGNSSSLHLSYPPGDTSTACVCTATNPVSSRAVAFHPSGCSHQPGGSARLRLELLVLLLLVVPVVVVLAVVLVGVCRTPHPTLPLADQEPSQDRAEHTIYSQVQRAEKPKATPAADPPSCTTIYAAATGPPAPPEPPTLQGHPPLSQEPTTVYVGVMMPRP